VVALEESFLMRRGGCEVEVNIGMAGVDVVLSLFVVTAAEEDILGRLAMGELGWEGGR
jgi:hypothetical protein